MQLRSLLVSLANAAKHRAALQGSLGELESALLGLSMCDLSGPLRGALEKSAGVQKRLRELSERQSESEEQIGGLTSVAEGYARLCGSVKVSLLSGRAWRAAKLTRFPNPARLWRSHQVVPRLADGRVEPPQSKVVAREG